MSPRRRRTPSRRRTTTGSNKKTGFDFTRLVRNSRINAPTNVSLDKKSRQTIEKITSRDNSLLLSPDYKNELLEVGKNGRIRKSYPIKYHRISKPKGPETPGIKMTFDGKSFAIHFTTIAGLQSLKSDYHIRQKEIKQKASMTKKENRRSTDAEGSNGTSGLGVSNGHSLTSSSSAATYETDEALHHLLDQITNPGRAEQVLRDPSRKISEVTWHDYVQFKPALTPVGENDQEWDFEILLAPHLLIESLTDLAVMNLTNLSGNEETKKAKTLRIRSEITKFLENRADLVDRAAGLIRNRGEGGTNTSHLRSGDLGTHDVGSMDYSFTSLDGDEDDEGVVGKFEVYLVDILDRWEAILGRHQDDTKPVEEYPFELFKPGTVNFGTKFLFRQEWTPLGTQRGDVIKTVPLGPKQVEKVSVKFTRTTKSSQETVTTKETERSNETTETTKDSTEIVKEMAANFSLSMTAGGSFNLGIGSANASTTMSSDLSTSVNSTTSNLSENVKKTASKLRTETKTTVSTEQESTYERTRSSEIQNPNDEISVTYVYSKLQRQYEVLTLLAETESVIFVAEKVPKASEVTEEWVRRHDWIIGKALLDDSFRPDLAMISRSPAPVNESNLKDDTKGILDSTTKHLGTLSGRKGNLNLSSIDYVNEANKGYRDAYMKYVAAQKLKNEREWVADRLLQHIRDNILHYCRAIWQHEDPEQRILRYNTDGLKIARDWQFRPLGGSTWNLADFLADVAAAEAANVPFELPTGSFVVSSSNRGYLDIGDIIIPTPIGYVGNYAAFAVRPEYRKESLFDVLAIDNAPFLYFGSNDEPKLMDPAVKDIVIEERDLDYSITAEEKRAIIEEFHDVRRRFERASDTDAFFADDSNFKKYIYEYRAYIRAREELGRRFLVDTGNLVLDIEPGLGTTLENFKLAHRVVDVEKALAERDKLFIENQRRQGLLDGKRYIDPDIDKVVIGVNDKNMDEFLNHFESEDDGPTT